MKIVDSALLELTLDQGFFFEVNMSVVPDDVRLIAPEFTTRTDDELNQFIALASADANAAFLCSLADAAITYLAAHKLSISTRGGSTSVTSEKVGDLQRSFGSATFGLAGTSYGQEYKRLVNSIAVTPIIANC